MATINPFQIPTEIHDIADEIRDFRVIHGTNLSVGDRRALRTRENALRGVATSLGALITQDILNNAISDKLTKLGDAINEAQNFLDDVANLRQILDTASKVLNLAGSIIALITPVG